MNPTPLCCSPSIIRELALEAGHASSWKSQLPQFLTEWKPVLETSHCPVSDAPQWSPHRLSWNENSSGRSEMRPIVLTPLHGPVRTTRMTQPRVLGTAPHRVSWGGETARCHGPSWPCHCFILFQTEQRMLLHFFQLAVSSNVLVLLLTPHGFESEPPLTPAVSGSLDMCRCKKKTQRLRLKYRPWDADPNVWVGSVCALVNGTLIVICVHGRATGID